MSQQLIAQHH